MSEIQHNEDLTYKSSNYWYFFIKTQNIHDYLGLQLWPVIKTNI